MLSYSESSSGTTFTTAGEMQLHSDGFYELTARDRFDLLTNLSYRNLHLEVCTSIVIVYHGKVLDVLKNKNELQVREDRCREVDVANIKVACIEDVLKLIKKGRTLRETPLLTHDPHGAMLCFS